jgi:hypothetical protein
VKIQTALLAALLAASLVACPTSAPPPALTNYADINATVNVQIAMAKTITTDGIAPITYQTDPPNSLPTGLTVNASNGDISGTPTAVTAQRTYTIIARDGGGREARASVVITVSSPPPTLTDYAAIIATVNVPLAVSKLTTTNGVAPITFSADPATPLPAGITVNAANGDISGTPTVASGQQTYRVIARDAANSEARASVSITVNGGLTPPALFGGIQATVGTPVSSALPAFTGGTLPRRIGISPALPTGLTLSFDDSTGIALISGTLTSAVSPTTYTVTLTDANNAIVTLTFNIAANGGLTPPAPFGGIQATIGVPINASLPVFTGGTLPRQIAIAPALPTGLTLSFDDNTGIASIAGTLGSALPPTAYTVTLTDASGATITQSFNLSLRPSLTISYPTSTVITALGLPIVIGAGAPIHNATNVSSGGAVTYSVAPNLPSGVTLNATTGVLSGTPTQVQAATTYTVTATNPADSDYAGSSATTQFSLEVTASPIITYPTGTLELTQGSAIAPITATISGGVGPYTVSDVSLTSLSSQNLTLQAGGNITGGPTRFA